MPPDVVAQETNALDDDLFSAAFDESVSSADPAPAATADPAPAATADPAPAATADPAPAATADPASAAPATTPVNLKELISEVIAATKTPSPTEPAAAAVAAPSAEEIAAEEQYRKDWPEQAAREDRLKKELESMKTLLTTTVEALKGQIQPVIDNAATTAEEKHYNTIIGAHPDAEAIVPKVEEWIKTQPKILQPQYTKIMAEGSAADVVELFTMFKEATKVPDAPTDEAAAAAALKEKQEKEERLNRMETTATVRTSVTTETDPSDFDSAFESEAKKFKNAA